MHCVFYFVLIPPGVQLVNSFPWGQEPPLPQRIWTTLLLRKQTPMVVLTQGRFCKWRVELAIFTLFECCI